jgi:hypothetical protein
LALSLILESIFSFLFPVCGRFRISVLLQVAQQRAIELFVGSTSVERKRSAPAAQRPAEAGPTAE